MLFFQYEQTMMPSNQIVPIFLISITPVLFNYDIFLFYFLNIHKRMVHWYISLLLISMKSHELRNTQYIIIVQTKCNWEFFIEGLVYLILYICNLYISYNWVKLLSKPITYRQDRRESEGRSWRCNIFWREECPLISRVWNYQVRDVNKPNDTPLYSGTWTSIYTNVRCFLINGLQVYS